MSSRKLAAILFADIVGYTALMQKDESRASALLLKFQHLMEDKVEGHHGRIVNFYGDGALCIFNSPLDTINCALDLQSSFNKEPIIPVRIGIHSGSVVFEGDKIYGDSVNLASRIESLGIPGSILISKKIQDDIKNQPVFKVRSLGYFEFKNVEQPMEVFALTNPNLAIPSRKEIEGKLRQKPRRLTNNILLWTAAILLLAIIIYIGISQNKPNGVAIPSENSIAVLNFDYIGDNQEYSYLAKGFPSAIAEKLSSIDGLKISPHSSVQYFSDNLLPLDQLADELNVAYYLKGFVQKAREEVLVRVQLFHALKDSMCWSQSKPFPVDSLLSVINKVSTEVASTLDLQLNDQFTDKAITTSSEAYNLYQKGNFFVDKLTTEDLFTAIDLYEKAHTVDSNFYMAYVQEAYCYIYLAGYFGGISTKDAFIKSKSLIDKAMTIDNNSLEIYELYGTMMWWLDWNYEEAIKAYDKMGPSSSIILYLQNGYFKKALEGAEIYIEREPLSPAAYWIKGTSLYHIGRHQEAFDLYEEGLSLFSHKADFHWEAGRVIVNLGKLERGIEVLERGLELSGGKSPNMLAYLAIAYEQTGKKEKADNILQDLEQRWENNELSLAFFIAHIYSFRGEEEKALSWLDIAYEDHELEMIWLKIEPQFTPLHKNPRFIELLDKVGFAKN